MVNHELNSSNLEFILDVVEKTMDKVVEATKDENIIEAVGKDLDAFGDSTSIIETIVIKKLRDFYKARGKAV